MFLLTLCKSFRGFIHEEQASGSCYICRRLPMNEEENWIFLA